MKMDNMKIPPSSIEAEQAVLGAILIDNSCTVELFEKVKSSDFYNASHQIIYKAIQSLSRKGSPIDLITLSEELENEKNGNITGGFSYIAELMNSTPSKANYLAYAEIIVSDSLAREAISNANEALEALYHNPRETRLSDAMGHLTAIQVDGNIEAISNAGEACDAFITEIERVIASGTGLSGMSTGYKWLDEHSGGAGAGDYICIAARSGAGKTTYAMNIFKHFIMKQRNSLFFSLEMKKQKLMQKMLSDMCNIPLAAIRKGDLDDHNWAVISEAMKRIKDCDNMFIDDSGGLTIIDIEARSRKLAAELRAKGQKLEGIWVDYIQKIRVDTGNRYSEVTDVSGRLKDLAMEIECPIFVLAQLKKNSTGRPNGSDLRETGAIENDADVIVFLHTDSPDLKPVKGMLTAEIFNKVRMGETGVRMLRNELDFQRFASTDSEDIEPEEEKPKRW